MAYRIWFGQEGTLEMILSMELLPLHPPILGMQHNQQGPVRCSCGILSWSFGHGNVSCSHHLLRNLRLAPGKGQCHCCAPVESHSRGTEGGNGASHISQGGLGFGRAGIRSCSCSEPPVHPWGVLLLPGCVTWHRHSCSLSCSWVSQTSRHQK